jgi:hypothetical protein
MQLQPGKFLIFLTLMLPVLQDRLDAQDLLLFFENSELLTNKELGSPFCKAFTDLDGDYRDDLIRLDGDDRLYIEFSSNAGQSLSSLVLPAVPGDIWTTSVGDLDNDGINEILTAGIYNGLTVWDNTNNGFSYDVKQKTIGDFYAQASNLVDINNDGWLDAFICNDDGLSKIFINDGNGQLIDSSDMIDMRTAIASDNSGNYASEWTDIDGDGDLDLYIAKCRINVNDFSDPRRINALFINENGEFREAAEEYGIAVGAQSWTANFGDIDNDGDMDMFITNHDFRSQLFENINNDTFVEINYLENGMSLKSYAFQSAFTDFDNDGWLDIIIAGQEGFILQNKGDKTFIRLDNPFGFEDIASFALGDINNDGFTDVLSSYNLLGSSFNKPDRFWQNLGNNNNYLTISLQGQNSNRSGIGARVEAYGSWGKQTRIIQSGIGYGTTHSLKARFGLGSSASIDSLLIHWPSGHVDIYDDIQINNSYLAIESSCLEVLPRVDLGLSLLDCNTDTICIHSSDNMPLTWNDGSFADSLCVISSGYVSAFSQLNLNCRLPVQSVYIDSLSQPSKPELDIINELRICKDRNFVIGERSNNEYLWQDGSVSTDKRIVEAGEYYLINSNICDTIYSDTVSVDIISPLSLASDSVIVITSPQPVNIDINKTATIFYRDSLKEDTLTMSGLFETDTIDSDTSFYYDFEIEELLPVYRGAANIDKLNLDDPLLLEAASLSLEFEVYESCTLHSIAVNATLPGKRIIEIYNLDSKETEFVKSYDLPKGIQRLELNIELNPAKYIIFTNTNSNIENFGFDAPALNVLDSEVQYPYGISDMIEITTSNIGTSHFPYFFDWFVEKKQSSCRSGLSRIDIQLNTTSSTDNSLSNTGVRLYPNPFINGLSFETDYNFDLLQIVNSQGANILSITNPGIYLELDMSSHAPGFYIVLLTDGDKTLKRKIVKLK